MSAYYLDRTLWKDSMTDNKHQFDTWVFSELYIQIGDVQSVVGVLTWFNVFCLGIVQEYSGATGDKG
jgi:hypothetical protein